MTTIELIRSRVVHLADPDLEPLEGTIVYVHHGQAASVLWGGDQDYVEDWLRVGFGIRDEAGRLVVPSVHSLDELVTR